MSGDYASALEAAGAKVVGFKEFGSYQGEWWAAVIVNGKRRFINGSYGSCSGCDSFEAEFGWSEGHCSAHYREEDQKGCAACKALAKKHEVKLAGFGAPYLESDYTRKDAIKAAGEHITWDSAAEEMVNWIQAFKFDGENNV